MAMILNGISKITSSSSIVVFFFISILISTVGHLPPSHQYLSLPLNLLSHPAAARLRTDHLATSPEYSTDFGNLISSLPVAVFYPSTPTDIADLLSFSFTTATPFSVSARGNGHSLRGQALSPAGVVIDMRSLDTLRPLGVSRVAVNAAGRYVDAGGEQLWSDVLRETLKHDLTPPSLTDYLDLTVGGTLSNAGIGGHAFLHGPQISNVHGLDVITGKGELVRCSENLNSDLFFAVLGGLGQFGIITRARIPLIPAPKKVKWVRMIYTDFEKFIADEELLTSRAADTSAAAAASGGFDYVEGSVIMDQTLVSNWRSSFFKSGDIRRIAKLASGRNIYCLEAAKYFYGSTATSMNDVEEEVDLGFLTGGLSFVPGFFFSKEVSYLGFLDRVRKGEKKLRSLGLWNVPHPWLNIFVPKSKILDVERGIINGVLKNSKPMGPFLIYPMNKSKWDERMSAVIAGDEVFYAVGLLRSAVNDGDVARQERENAEILGFLRREGIEYKQYMPYFSINNSVDLGSWEEHFGSSKWGRFKEMKNKYDPRAILSQWQRIFSERQKIRISNY